MSGEMETADRAAREAGRVLLSLYHGETAVEAKGAAYNLVTEADRKSEEVILSIVREAFPDHSILSEESGASHRNSEYLWAIDPLDGTNNYAHRFPFFSVSIALWRGRTPILGVVYDPLREELFHAERGAGATLNGHPIRVTDAATLGECILATGFYYDRGEMMRRTLRQIEGFFDAQIRGIRRTGSAALDLCYVASGRLDGFWELRLSPWDFAAGGLIVQEAGGRVTDVNGTPFDLSVKNVLASNGKVHEAMLGVVSR